MKIRRLLPIILVLLLSACAHQPSQKDLAVLQVEIANSQTSMAQLEIENTQLQQELEQTRQDLANKTIELDACLNAKQTMLDESIECLEENKGLLLEIQRFKKLIQERQQAQWRMNKAYEYVLAALETERMSDQVYIIKTPEHVKIILPQRVLFPTVKSAWLTPRGRRLTNKIAESLKQLDPATIEIRGHTDNTPMPEGKAYASNWDLAQARSLAVLKILEEKGFPTDKMHSVSYGDTRPLADNNTQDGRAMNRRVEIVIIP